MGVTNFGYPYPESTDPVAQGAAAIQALATAVNTIAGVRAQGMNTITFNNDLSASVSLTFPVNRFPTGSTPRVVTSPGNALYLTGAQNVTETGVTLVARHITNTAQTSTVSVSWIAHL